MIVNWCTDKRQTCGGRAGEIFTLVIVVVRAGQIQQQTYLVGDGLEGGWQTRTCQIGGGEVT